MGWGKDLITTSLRKLWFSVLEKLCTPVAGLDGCLTNLRLGGSHFKLSVYVSSVCGYVHRPAGAQGLRTVRCPGTGCTDGCEPSDLMLGTNLRSSARVFCALSH